MRTKWRLVTWLAVGFTLGLLFSPDAGDDTPLFWLGFAIVGLLIGVAVDAWDSWRRRD